MDIVSTFNVERANAERILNTFVTYRGDTSDFLQLFSSGYTLLIPYGTKKSISAWTKTKMWFQSRFVVMNPLPAVLVLVFMVLMVAMKKKLKTPSTSIIDMVEQNRSESHDPQIEIEGSYVFKATAVKSLFSTNPLSKDRRRRVRGFSKYTDSEPQQSATAIDTSLVVGYPLLIKVKQKMQIAKINGIKKANKKVKLLNVGELNDLNISIDAIILKIEDVDDHYIWKGEFIGESFKSTGKDCYAIQPELEEVDGKLHFTFDKQLILDLEVAVTVQEERERSGGASANVPSTSTPGSNKNKKHIVDCFVCKKKVDITVMRKHVGEHIMKSTVSGIDVCGFCGKKTCENILQGSKQLSVFC